MIPKPKKERRKRHKQTIACDISQVVKKAVWRRDNERCIICGNPVAMPNAHYIPRSRGGLGIEENIATLCNQCHYDFDNGDKRQEYGETIREYLISQYPHWDEQSLYYRKG